MFARGDGPFATRRDARAAQAGHRQPVRRAPAPQVMSDAADFRSVGRMPFAADAALARVLGAGLGLPE